MMVYWVASSTDPAGVQSIEWMAFSLATVNEA